MVRPLDQGAKRNELGEPAGVNTFTASLAREVWAWASQGSTPRETRATTTDEDEARLL